LKGGSAQKIIKCGNVPRNPRKNRSLGWKGRTLLSSRWEFRRPNPLKKLGSSKFVEGLKLQKGKKLGRKVLRHGVLPLEKSQAEDTTRAAGDERTGQG